MVVKTANIMRHMELLGHKVTDKVTGFKGIVSSIAFDLYGCIQAIVTPEVKKGEVKVEDSRWFDVQRLTVTSKKPVMPMPDYDKGYVAEGSKGAAPKPAGRL
jgi:hypothetical protein